MSKQNLRPDPYQQEQLRMRSRDIGRVKDRTLREVLTHGYSLHPFKIDHSATIAVSGSDSIMDRLRVKIGKL